MGDFSGQSVFVTGGSGGVGRAIGQEFAARGANVALTYYSNRAKAEEAAEAVRGYGVEALTMQADLADHDAVAAVFARAAEAFGSVDILTHAAGARVDWTPVRDHDPCAWAKFIAADLIGAFNAVREAVRHMHAHGRGVIVAISSIAAQMCQSRNSQGAAAKAGLEALVRVVAREEGRHGIRANAISIGLTDTEQAREAFERWGEVATQKVIAGIPLGRVAKPEEIACMASYLASEYGAYITGKVIQVDGGQIIAG